MKLQEYEELNKLAHEMSMLICLQDLVLNYGETVENKGSLYKYLHEKQSEILNKIESKIRRSAPIEALVNKNEPRMPMRLE